MKRTALSKTGKSETAKCKVRIQALLRQIAIKRDGGCVLRHYPNAGQCGGLRKDGELIYQAEHLNTRERNISYGDMRNIVCLCKYHHGYWKPKNGAAYWNMICNYIGEQRWAWLQRIIADRKSYPMGIYDWQKVELSLQKELEQLSKIE